MSGQVMVRCVWQTETYNNRKSTGWKIEINLCVTQFISVQTCVSICECSRHQDKLTGSHTAQTAGLRRTLRAGTYIYWLREKRSNEWFNLPNTPSFYSCEASCEWESLCVVCVWEWILETHSDSHTETISAGLFLDRFIHILQLHLVF